MGYYLNCLPVLDTGSSKNISVLRSLDPASNMFRNETLGSCPGWQIVDYISASVLKLGFQVS